MRKGIFCGVALVLTMLAACGQKKSKKKDPDPGTPPTQTITPASGTSTSVPSGWDGLADWTQSARKVVDNG